MRETSAQLGLRIQNAAYRYRRSSPWVLSELTLELDQRSTCLLGPNGAGKTTLLGLATGRLLPLRGHVRLGDLALTSRTRRSWAQVTGWAPQDVPVAPGLTAAEQVAYVAWLHGLSRSDARDAALWALDLVDLSDRAATRTAELSGGQRRRVGIAAAVAHRPRLVVLDEPTAGLDPEQRGHFREVLARVCEDASVVVATHQTEDVSTSYDEVVVLAEGRIRFAGPTADFLAHQHSTVKGHLNPAEAAYVALMKADG